MANLLSTSALRAVLGKLLMSATQPVTGASNASPAVVTVAGHGFSSGDVLYHAAVGGNTNVNSVAVAVVINANTYSLKDLHSGSAINGNSAYTSGGTVQRINVGFQPHDIANIDRTLESVSYKRGTDGNFTAEATLQSIFGA